MNVEVQNVKYFIAERGGGGIVGENLGRNKLTFQNTIPAHSCHLYPHSAIVYIGVYSNWLASK